MVTPDNIAEVLARDPGNEVFVEYAETLRNSGRVADAIITCVAGLSANPLVYRGRFLLARIYFEQGYLQFALRELKELSRCLPGVDALKRLIARFEPEGPQQDGRESSSEETVAESDLDIDQIELVDDDEGDLKN